MKIERVKRQYLVYDREENLVGEWSNPKALIRDLNISTSGLLYKSINNDEYIRNNIIEKKEYKIILNKEKVNIEIKKERKPVDNSEYLSKIRTYLKELPVDAKLVEYCPTRDLYAQPNGTIIGTDINGLYIIKPYLNNYKGVKYGYYKFHYKGKMYRLHYLLAKLFVPGFKKGLCVDHINNDSTDNRIENLQWITRGQNSEKFWASLSDEEYENYKNIYSEGLKRAHAAGKYKKHLEEVHNNKRMKKNNDTL